MIVDLNPFVQIALFGVSAAMFLVLLFVAAFVIVFYSR